MRYHRTTILVILASAIIISALGAYGQNFDKVEITTQKVSGNIFILQGQGGNIGVCAGDDGVFIVDDQFAPLTEKIKSAIAKISKQDIRFVVNTHWHPDHVGGNENLGKMGAVIIAHENVRHRMGREQFIRIANNKVPPSPKAALPIITFSRNIRFHLNGEEIDIFHVKHAHTDGDAVVFFKKANVLHTGDIYFSGMYPFIDVSSNGSVDGLIKALKYVLSIINDNTKVIPGHGAITNKAELVACLEMLETLQSRVSEHISKGKTLKEIQALKPSNDFDAVWADGYLNGDQFIHVLYDDLSRHK